MNRRCFPRRQSRANEGVTLARSQPGMVRRTGASRPPWASVWVAANRASPRASTQRELNALRHATALGVGLGVGAALDVGLGVDAAVDAEQLRHATALDVGLGSGAALDVALSVDTGAAAEDGDCAALDVG